MSPSTNRSPKQVPVLAEGTRICFGYGAIRLVVADDARGDDPRFPSPGVRLVLLYGIPVSKPPITTARIGSRRDSCLARTRNGNNVGALSSYGIGELGYRGASEEGEPERGGALLSCR